MRTSSSRWNKLRQRGRFADDRKPWCLAHLRPCCPAFRFSTRVGWFGRGTQTWQQCVHPASHLLRGRGALLAFPRTPFSFDHIASQHQMIVDTGDDVTPPLKLLWGSQTRCLPQQSLFVKAIAMLLPKTQHIPQSDLNDIGFLISYPHKPAHAWITLFVGRMRPHDPHNGHFQPASLFDMHTLPAGDFHWTTFGIRAFPHAIWLAMRRGIFGLQFGPIFAWAPFLARWSRSRSIQTAIAFETTQYTHIQRATPAPQPVRIIASVQHHNGVFGQMGHQPSELSLRYLNGGGVRCHPLLIQDVRPATSWVCQDDHSRKLPAKRDWLRTFWQIVHVLGRTIGRGDCFRTRNTTGIDSQPQPFPRIRLGHVADKEFSQALFIDASIFKCLIQARPLALKPQRLRHFGKRCGLRFCHQRIDGIEQGILGSQKTVIEIVTELSQCVTVIIHSVKFLCVLFLGTLLD